MQNSMFSPSVLEVEAAKAVFLKRMEHYAPSVRRPMGSPGYMSPETAVTCALAEVWRQGRAYQCDQDNSMLLELAGMEVRS